MTTPSPPKPWERAVASAAAGTTTPIASAAMTTPSSLPSADASSGTPALPDRPSTLNNVVNQTASNYANQNRFGTGMGASPYSSPYSSYSSYSSPYNRFGGGGMYGGGMYGGGYGGYGGGMYGGSMYGGGYGNYPGMPGDPNNQSLTQTWNQSTAATFQIMESIVGAFGGFAQMLESAYMTTHSSFFAMVSMAEQLGNLRQTLGSVLGIFTLLRWMRTLIAKITGRPPPADATALTPANFSSFLSGGHAPATLPDGSPAPPRPSKKPFIMFAIAVFGLPYLMGKLIRAMARSQEEEQKRQQEQMSLTYTNPNGEQVPIDPRKLDFCRVLYDYTPAPNSGGMDLEVKKGDLVAVLSKTDPMGNASEWWRCRARDGKMGYLPSPYLEPIQRPAQRPAQGQITDGPAASAPGSRTATMKGSAPLAATKLLEQGDRAKSLSSIYSPTGGIGNAQSPVPVALGAKGPEMKSKPGDISPESFQKSAFYS
ncbi:Peroxisomal membrane protein PAS20 [Knufia peltigerae]|uniref:Peroxisomal membrane protein PEX13 n=1 Tax=Knufia peltigerae TaxID=1002370 RepID=A0AA39CY93_9EURO|nr:Peroxisomal membrane protein PAS20 [Knufia peltigerae]